MSLIVPYIPSAQEHHEDELWVSFECYLFYVKQRCLNCTFMEIMDLWLLAPYCGGCAISDPFEGDRYPDRTPDTWEIDLLFEVGRGTFERTQRQLKEDPEFSYLCKRCGNELRPWNNDEVYVVSYHLEEHYRIPLETPAQKEPPKRLKQQIKKLYDYKCFRCDSANRSLCIDHIVPQDYGGDAAFRNLQPLCGMCGNIKGNKLPKEVKVYSTIYFGPYPSDSYEGLFW